MDEIYEVPGIVQIAVDAYDQHCQGCYTCQRTFLSRHGDGTGVACPEGWRLLADMEATLAVCAKRSA